MRSTAKKTIKHEDKIIVQVFTKNRQLIITLRKSPANLQTMGMKLSGAVYALKIRSVGTW